MENSRIIELMAKKAGRSASPEELEELSVLLGQHPDYGYLHEVVIALKGNPDHLEFVTPREELAVHGWEDLSGRLQEHAAVRGGLLRFGGWHWVAAAAVVFFVVLVSGGFYYRHRHAAAAVPPSLVTAQTGYGVTKRLVLPDGTKVSLNAGSRLIYPERFSGGSREVELEGEAFFDVAKDMKAPFSVHARRIRIGVLGTSFDVKAYHEDKEIETTLITGKVQVTLDEEPEKPILLSPHEKLTIAEEREEQESPVDKADTKQGGLSKAYNALRYQVQALPKDSGIRFGETAWLDNRLVLSNESFEAVARMLERRYDVEIRFEDEGLMQEHVSGVFERERIGQVLEILKMTTGFQYRMEGRVIYLSKKAK